MRTLTINLGLTIVLLVCSTALSAPTLDQFQENESGETGYNENYYLGQTFTAGLTGNWTTLK